MIERVIEYAESVNSNSEVLEWLNTAAKKALKGNR